MAKPIRALELNHPMIQFLIIFLTLQSLSYICIACAFALTKDKEI